MNINEVKKALIEDKKLDAVQIERLTPKLEALSPDILEALVRWIETDEISSPEYGGLTVNDIIKTQPTMNVLGAFLSLDWLRRDPDKAKRAIANTIPVKRIDP